MTLMEMITQLEQKSASGSGKTKRLKQSLALFFQTTYLKMSGKSKPLRKCGKPSRTSLNVTPCLTNWQRVANSTPPRRRNLSQYYNSQGQFGNSLPPWLLWRLHFPKVKGPGLSSTDFPTNTSHSLALWTQSTVKHVKSRVLQGEQRILVRVKSAQQKAQTAALLSN